MRAMFDKPKEYYALVMEGSTTPEEVTGEGYVPIYIRRDFAENDAHYEGFDVLPVHIVPIAAWNTRTAPASPNDTQGELVDAHKLAVDVLTEVKYACQYWPDYDMPINLPERVRDALSALTEAAGEGRE